MKYLTMTGFTVRTASDRWTLGYEGENNSRTLQIKTTDDLTDFATVNLLIDTIDCGAMTVETVSNYKVLSMVLTAGMLGEAGMKTCQLLMMDSGGTVIKKTSQFYMVVGHSNVIEGTVPDSPVIIAITDYIDDAINERVGDEILEGKINDWLDDHPEATTTVQDGTISEAKLASALKPKIMNAYVTPQMYGAVGDGEADDTDAIQSAINNGSYIFIPSGTYRLTNPITIGSRKTICGDGYSTKILFNSEEGGVYAFNILGEHGLSAIKNMEIIGNGENDSVEVGGVSLNDRPSTGLIEYDSMNAIEDVLVRHISGTAFYIGSNQRGSRLKNCTAYFVGGYGFQIVGTDNMLQFCSSGVCGKTGFLISQNNRIVSIKAFRCGEKDASQYYGIHVQKHFNNMNAIDVQENHVIGLFVEGSGNSIFFNADGNGFGEDSNESLSLIKIGENACCNRLVGNITQGTLNYFINTLIEVYGMARCLNNNIQLLYNESLNISRVNIAYMSKEICPSNSVVINNIDYSNKYRSLDSTIQVTPIYSGHTGWDDPISPVDGVYTLTAPLSFSNLGLGSGVNMRLKLADLPTYDANNIKVGTRICVSFDIDSNVPIDNAITVNCAVHASGAPLDFWSGGTRKINRGTFNGILYCTSSIASELKNTPASNLRLGLYRFSRDAYESEMPETTEITISNIRYAILY